MEYSPDKEPPAIVASPCQDTCNCATAKQLWCHIPREALVARAELPHVDMARIGGGCGHVVCDDELECGYCHNAVVRQACLTCERDQASSEGDSAGEGEAEASPPPAEEMGCPAVLGVCGHVFHAHCIARWLQGPTPKAITVSSPFHHCTITAVPYFIWMCEQDDTLVNKPSLQPVSYTHLTLPTKRIV